MVQTLQPPLTKKFSREMVDRGEFPEATPSFGFPFARLFEDPWGWKSLADRPYPSLDVVESDSAYLFAVELPGSRKEDIRLQFENGVFTISGDRKFDSQWKDWNLHRSERRYGTFCRSIALPTGVAVEGARAEMKDGMLYVTFPKSEEAKPHFLKVN
jgi:HSP20 family protein